MAVAVAVRMVVTRVMAARAARAVARAAAEGRRRVHLGAEFVRERKRERRLASAGRASEQQRAARHLLGLDQFHRDAHRLARLLLSYQAGGDLCS